ncbi:MAG: hypothetical protein FWD56_01170 [Bacteroidales bacterium]|nr:hypothetical protein [Bacteroidales bacterium]
MTFSQSFASFLHTLQSPLILESNAFLFTERGLRIVPVSLDDESVPIGEESEIRTIYLWEDMWTRKRPLVQKWLAGEIEGRESVFARKCSLQVITKKESDFFFEETHLLGAARAKYRYGLFNNGQLIAAAAFSGMRMIRRGDRLCRSAEWVRYASLPKLTVVGGMGKLLSAFVAEHHPDDVMSYANKDWSEGAAYTKLGFEAAGETPVQYYWIDPQTMQRYPVKRHPFPQPHWKRVYGLGSLKFMYYL